MSYAAVLSMQLAALEFDRQRLDAMTPEARAAELHRRKLKRLSEKDERMQRRLARHRAAVWKRRWGPRWRLVPVHVRSAARHLHRERVVEARRALCFQLSEEVK